MYDNATLNISKLRNLFTVTSQLIYYDVTDDGVSHVRIENDASEFEKEEEEASSLCKDQFSFRIVCLLRHTAQ